MNASDFERGQLFELDERLSGAGEAVMPLKLDEVDVLADRLAQEGVEAVAVCLINSYANKA